MIRTAVVFWLMTPIAASSAIMAAMIAIPADTPDSTIAAMIADEAAIGVINQKTTAVRIIPYGKEGDMLELGGLLGSAPVMKVNKASSADFIARGGQIPAPVHSFKN